MERENSLLHMVLGTDPFIWVQAEPCVVQPAIKITLSGMCNQILENTVCGYWKVMGSFLSHLASSGDSLNSQMQLQCAEEGVSITVLQDWVWWGKWMFTYRL
jgi:hypothetical protein